MKRIGYWLLVIGYCLSAHAQVDTLAQDSIVRVLAIGNSFSQDAVEQYLWELAQEAGVKMIIGNAYRGGQGFCGKRIAISQSPTTGTPSTVSMSVENSVLPPLSIL